jgi:phosphate starvation-inducible PhoH-like protein
MCGYSANYGVQIDNREMFKVPPKPNYRLYVTAVKQVTTQAIKHTSSSFNGQVYCVTVPSGMIVVRQNGYVFVSGNCQNLTVHEMKAMLTRVGENCQIILDGDIEQVDLKESSGLSKIVHLAKKHQMNMPVIEFTIDDVVRSAICKEWLRAFAAEGI